MSRLNVLTLLLLSIIPATLVAKDEPARERGVLAEMQSVSCGTLSKTGSSVAGVLITGSSHTQSSELLCQEYVLKADRVTYRIRPKEQKHPVLLHVGDEAEFRLKKDKLLLRIPETDNKEREYVVVSMLATSEFNNELAKKQHPPKPHGVKLDVNASDDAQPAQPPSQPVAVPSAPPQAAAQPAPTPLQASASQPSAQAAPAPASQPTLTIVSTPPGADIFLDSASAGRTPTTLTLSPGQHTVQVVAPGYKDWANTISIAPGAQQKIDVALTK